MKIFNLKSALLALTALSLPGMANAAPFDRYIGFGDSTLDSGYFRYHTTGSDYLDAALVAAVKDGATGAFVGTGVMNSTILAEKFGLSAVPSDNGGTNYAIGGAESSLTVGAKISTVEQIESYLSSVNGAADADGLYIVATGSNDLHDSSVSVAGWLDAQASALATEVAALQAAGARTIMVTNPYNSAIYAGYGGDIASENAEAYATTVAYEKKIWSSLTAAGVNYIPVDEDSLFKYVVKHPTLFGFTADSVLAANAPCYSSSALICTSMSEADMQSYLFVDGKHMTTAGQTLVADLEYSLLLAPSEMALMAESVVQNDLSRLATLQGQIDHSGQNRAPNGINAWVSAGANHLSIKNTSKFPNVSGTTFGGMVGVDYLTPSGIVVGVAFAAGGQAQQFSTGGDFNQTDEGLSLYAAYKDGMVWADAVASYGLLQNHLVRPVTLGIFTDDNIADSAGHSLAFAARGGVDFDLGSAVTHGPVAGVVLQRVVLGGFTETGVSGVTALSFDSQTRDALITQLGWRGAARLGHWKPFAQIAWNHDWAGKHREITTSITSTTAAPYTTDARPGAADWGTASLGVSYKLGSSVTLQATTSAVFLNPQVTSYGGDFGLNVSF